MPAAQEAGLELGGRMGFQGLGFRVYGVHKPNKVYTFSGIVGNSMPTKAESVSTQPLRGFRGLAV